MNGWAFLTIVACTFIICLAWIFVEAGKLAAAAKPDAD